MGGNQQGQIPTDVYLSFVRSLYGNRMTLFAGMIAHVTICLLIFFKLKDPAYIVFGGVILAVWIVRQWLMIRFDEVDFTGCDRKKIALWEKRSIAGAGMTTLMLGLITGYSFLFVDDTFAQIACLSVALSAMVSVVGRNFGTKFNVYVVTLAACMPIMAALLLAGSIYMAVLGILIIPLVMTTISMATGVREFFIRQRAQSPRNGDYRRPLQCGAQQHAARPVHAGR